MSEETSGTGSGDLAERRRAERIPARVEVRFHAVTDAARALRAYSLNLSVGGLCLRTTRRYEIGDGLKLSMEIAGEQFALQGAVAWVRGEAIGIRFENVTPEVRERLETMVAQLRK